MHGATIPVRVDINAPRGSVGNANNGEVSPRGRESIRWSETARGRSTIHIEFARGPRTSPAASLCSQKKSTKPSSWPEKASKTGGVHLHAQRGRRTPPALPPFLERFTNIAPCRLLPLVREASPVPPRGLRTNVRMVFSVVVVSKCPSMNSSKTHSAVASRLAGA